eukprot:TRINITY_DN3923_c0_g1_i1.p1 TRINITY_DN3923_c0_g1~~TRINITY_DN3923_c0_g1_i1.p1  ORF type:complete len:291 (+),score=65.12 TRINITY_DN3923_c0_g1_i1:58-930(+)
MQVSDTVKALEENPKSVSLQRDLLKQLRFSKIKIQPSYVVKYGDDLINSSASLSAVEKWEVHEQVLLAALDTHNIALATKYLNKIAQQFPKSARVKRMRGMFFEAQGMWKEADVLYREILASDPSDFITMKRQISIQKSLGNIETASHMLETYLTINMADIEAWLELAHLRSILLQYSSVANCFEEVLLANPVNHVFYTKYAEVVYTMGGIDNFRLARKCYARSLELNPDNNLRSLWGLCSCSLAILSSKGKKEEVQDLHNWAKQKIMDHYKKAQRLAPIASATVLQLCP